MVKKLKWNLVLMSALYLGLGVFLLMKPTTALNIVCYALGAVVLACAAVQLIRYFVVERGVPDPAQRHRGEYPAHRVRPVRDL